MRIVMLRTARGSETGFETAEYFENTCYDVGDNLGTQFLADSHAELCGVRYATVQWKSGLRQRVPVTPWIKDLQAKGAVQVLEAA